jgi:hypothetical protein
MHAVDHIGSPGSPDGDRPAAHGREAGGEDGSEDEILESYTDSLAALVATERGISADDVESWVIANALIGIHRALITYTHRQALAGVENPQIARNLRAQGKRALASLEHGFG